MRPLRLYVEWLGGNPGNLSVLKKKMQQDSGGEAITLIPPPAASKKEQLIEADYFDSTERAFRPFFCVQSDLSAYLWSSSPFCLYLSTIFVDLLFDPHIWHHILYHLTITPFYQITDNHEKEIFFS